MFKYNGYVNKQNTLNNDIKYKKNVFIFNITWT